MNNEEEYDTVMKLQEAINARDSLTDFNTLNMLTETDQINLLDDIIRKSIYASVEEYCDEDKVVNAITFDNSHRIAYKLATGPNLSAAKALYEELKYWADSGRFD